MTRRNATALLGVLFILIAQVSCSQDTLIDNYVLYRTEASCDVHVCDNATLKKEGATVDDTEDALFQFNPPIDCCSGCYCDDECARRGDCCPDHVHESSSLLEDNFPRGGLYRCVPGNLKTRKNLNYRMITKCLNNFTDAEVRTKCVLDPTTGLEYYIPVSSNITGESYRNRYCAECNHEHTDALVVWTVRVECLFKSIQSIALATIIRDVLAVSGCNLYINPPATLKSWPLCKDTYDTCNQTGLWPTFNEDIADGCESYRSPFHTEYRNAFCYACNTASGIANVRCVEIHEKEESSPPSLSILFDFNTPDDVVQTDTMANRCPQDTVYNPYLDLCHVINCEEGHNYIEGQCRPIIEGKCMDAFLLLRPLTDISTIHAEDIREALEQTFDDSIQLSDTSSWDVHTLYTDYNGILFILHVRFIYDIELGHNLTEIPKHDFTVHYGNTSHVNKISFDITIQDVIGLYVDARLRDEDPNPLHWFNVPDLGWTDTMRSRGNLPCIRNKKEDILSQFTACPWIEIALQDFNVSLTNDGISFFGMNMVLSNKTFKPTNPNTNGLNPDTDAVKICVHDFLPTTLQHDAIHSDHVPFSEAAGYLTLSTSLMSISSSLFIVITYALFKSLRTQPGVNNMMLSIHMVSGRSLYIFGIRQDTSTILCSVIGGTAHFLELATILWYLVCSFHMFRVFRNTAPARNNSVLKTTVKYALFVTITSLSFVVINVGTSLVATDYASLGYGKSGLCWISRPMFVAYTITMPALLTVICNIALFLVAVYKIGHGLQAHIQSTKHHRQTFLIYVKLSVLTGLTWITILPYIFTREEVFNYIFICLHGCSGVFVMVAFIMNRRVFLLYKALVLQTRKHDSVSRERTFSTEL